MSGKKKKKIGYLQPCRNNWFFYFLKHIKFFFFFLFWERERFGQHCIWHYPISFIKSDQYRHSQQKLCLGEAPPDFHCGTGVMSATSSVSSFKTEGFLLSLLAWQNETCLKMLPVKEQSFFFKANHHWFRFVVWDASGVSFRKQLPVTFQWVPNHSQVLETSGHV